VDQWVLQVQQWVNERYGSVTGFAPVAEDGIPGPATYAALTRGLQHELGIAELSDTFGPRTLDLLTQRGGVRTSEPDADIIRIVQGGLICKGYQTGELTGVFDPRTTSAMSAMTADAGLQPSADAIAPKVVKGLLSPDSYRLADGGSRPLREFQRWLNDRYLGRRNFFLLPCDGTFSRTVATATCFAVQFDLGLTDDQATGTVGPLTRAGLKAHEIGEGSSGAFVSLFTGAMLLNRTRLENHSLYRHFTDTFDDRLSSAVRAFQSFSALPVTGRGDFATWCQLLTSTGDPDRPCAAVDCITTITDERAATLTAAGYRFVGRYLDERPSPHPLNKSLQPGELEVIFRHGLRVFPISEYGGAAASYYTREQGITDALGAHDAAAGYGFEPGTAIYFAVDYDATQAEIDANVLPYFRGVVEGLLRRGGRYVHAVYGSRNVCTQVSRRTGACWSFVAGMSSGWSGNLGFPLPDNWAFSQVQTTTLGTGAGGLELDRDAHRPGTDPGVSSVTFPLSVHRS
jgi:peptidoglycan hydrolase-like protein with peptidoglycan-binding domain